MIERDRIDSIQVLRAISYILIFLSHVEIVATGAVAVSIFFVISGFCMVYSYLGVPNKNTYTSPIQCVRFGYSKIRKLYPLHLFTMIGVACIVFIQSISKLDKVLVCKDLLYLLLNSALLQSWIPIRDCYYSFNAVSWYLSTLIFSYCTFGFARQYLEKCTPKKAIKAGAIILYICCVFQFFCI